MIIKTNWLIPKNMQAITIGNVILIRPNAADFKDIIEHEKVHIAQFKKEPFLFWFKYMFSRKHRLAYECEAYAIQAKYLMAGKTILKNKLLKVFTEYLFNNYRLGYTKQYIKDRLEYAFNVI